MQIWRSINNTFHLLNGLDVFVGLQKCLEYQVFQLVSIYSSYFKIVLTRACPSHNPQLLSSTNEETESVKDYRCVLPVLHFIIHEGNSSTLWPVVWNFHILYAFWSLRLANL